MNKMAAARELVSLARELVGSPKTASDRDIVMALIETAERETDMENVYNDETGQSFSWAEVKRLAPRMDKDVILALVDTAKNVTDLENVYNDKTGQSFSWAEVERFVRKLR